MSMAPLRLRLAPNGVLMQEQPMPRHLVTLRSGSLPVWRASRAKPISQGFPILKS